MRYTVRHTEQPAGAQTRSLSQAAMRGLDTDRAVPQAHHDRTCSAPPKDGGRPLLSPSKFQLTLTNARLLRCPHYGSVNSSLNYGWAENLDRCPMLVRDEKHNRKYAQKERWLASAQSLTCVFSLAMAARIKDGWFTEHGSLWPGPFLDSDAL